MINNLRKAAFAGRNHSLVHTTAKINLAEKYKAVSNMGDAINHDDSMILLPRLMGVLSQDNLHDSMKMDELNTLRIDLSTVTDNR